MVVIYHTESLLDAVKASVRTSYRRKNQNLEITGATFLSVIHRSPPTLYAKSVLFTLIMKMDLTHFFSLQQYNRVVTIIQQHGATDEAKLKEVGTFVH
jgi:hypothetical protein